MSASILMLLAVILAGLLVLGASGAWLGTGAREALGFGGAGLSGLAAILVVAALAAADGPSRLDLPAGLPGNHFRLLLDPLSGFFALLVFTAGTAAVVHAAAAERTGPPGSLGGMIAAVGGLGLAALAGDALAFATGLALAGSATWAAAESAASADAAPGNAARGNAALGNAALGNAGWGHAAWGALPATLLAAAAVIAATRLLGAGQDVAGFTALRATPAPASLAAPTWIGLVLCLAPLAGLAPLRLAPDGATDRAPSLAASLLQGTAMPVAFLALLRVTAGLTAPPLDAWCGVALLVLGAAAMLTGGIGATRGDTLGAVLAAGTTHHAGIAASALGIAVIGQALDQPQIVGMALAAVLVATAAQAVCGTLCALCARAMHHSAATRRITRLGGMIHTMPLCGACLLVGLFGLSALPPGPGFAVLWLLFQALLAEIQAAAPAFQTVLIAAAAALGLGAALSVAALVRLVGVVCLGRPRTPRTAAATPLSRAAANPLLCLAGACLGVGMFIAVVLRVLVNPAVQGLLGANLGPRASLAGVVFAPGGGYAALPVGVLLAIAWGAVVWGRRRLQPAGPGASPAWEDGLATSAPWLPFGDPVTQTSGMGFTPVPDELTGSFPKVRSRVLPRFRDAAVAVTVLALLLGIVRLIPR